MHRHLGMMWELEVYSNAPTGEWRIAVEQREDDGAFRLGASLVFKYLEKGTMYLS